MRARPEFFRLEEPTRPVKKFSVISWGEIVRGDIHATAHLPLDYLLR
jgi:hypothetical protein